MTTDTLPLEKCIADEPPVHPEETLNNPCLTSLLEHPPQTRLLLEGFDPEEITANFLVTIHDLADERGLALDSISVDRYGR